MKPHLTEEVEGVVVEADANAEEEVATPTDETASEEVSDASDRWNLRRKSRWNQ